MLKHYKILGLPYGASKEDIKTAFRKMASIYHPDKPTGDLKKMQEITQAYSELMKYSAPSSENPFSVHYGTNDDIERMMRSFQEHMERMINHHNKDLRKRQQHSEKAKQFVDILKNRS